MGGNVQIIIPMSGIGKRFLEAGYKTPKPLIEVDGIPIIQHVINLFPGTASEDFIFICNRKHLAETNMKDILLSICPSCKIYEVPDNDKRGPVNAISKIFEHIQDESEVIVSYCDYGTYWDYDSFLIENRSKDADGAIACYKGFHPHMLGKDKYAFVREMNKWMLEIKEKECFTNNKMNEYASNGTYYFKSGSIVKKYFKKLMDLKIELNGEYYVSLVYNLLVQDNLKVNIFEIENMLQWGTPYDMETYNGWSKYFSNIIKGEKDNSVNINNTHTTTIIPMSGKGSRFSECGYDLPKPLLDINNKPMVIQAIDCLPQSNNNMFVCLNEHIRRFDLVDTIKIDYPNAKIIGIDKTTEGQACTCEIGIKESKIDLEKPILISACDNGVYYNKNEYYKLLSDGTNDIIVWTFRNNQSSKNNPDMYAWLDVDKNNYIKHVSCKKFIYDNPLTTHAIIGTMFFRKAKYFMDGLQKNYDENKRTNGEFYVDDVLNQNIKSGLKVKVFEVENYICWGTPDDYKTYIYWRDFFDKCEWHPYRKIKDITYK